MDIDAEISVGPLSQNFSDDKTSFGDITLIPGLFYWNNGDNLHFSQAFYIVAPTGNYDEDDLANTGLNYWTFETDFAMTYLNNETGQDYSVVLGYSYNTENDDTDYQSGDEVHIDYVFNQFLSESLAIGLHGFFYKQASGDGAILGDFKAKASGIGQLLIDAVVDEAKLQDWSEIYGIPRIIIRLRAVYTTRLPVVPTVSSITASTLPE